MLLVAVPQVLRLPPLEWHSQAEIGKMVQASCMPLLKAIAPFN
ncbi:hypothetical protein [Nostoc commune]|nr:hypothetical protein [Nostoc commune]